MIAVMPCGWHSSRNFASIISLKPQRHHYGAGPIVSNCTKEESEFERYQVINSRSNPGCADVKSFLTPELHNPSIQTLKIPERGVSMNDLLPSLESTYSYFMYNPNNTLCYLSSKISVEQK